MIDVFYYDGKVKTGKIDSPKPLWIDITGLTQEEADNISKQFSLHPLTTEDILNANARVKVEEFEEYLFCVFYGMQKDLVEIDFILGKDYLITSHKAKIPSFEQLKSDPPRLENRFKKGMPLFFHRLLDMEIDNFSPALEKFDDEIENIEEEATADPRPELMTKILKMKRTLVSIKRVTMPQREKIGFLAKNEYAHIPKKTLPYFRDIYDHAIRVSDTIDSYREAIANTFDAYMSAVSNRMNEVMKVLSIIATIALPLTVISGIYGTNFTNLPGQHAYAGFWIMVGIMLAMVAGMLVYFKVKKWI